VARALIQARDLRISYDTRRPHRFVPSSPLSPAFSTVSSGEHYGLMCFRSACNRLLVIPIAFPIYASSKAMLTKTIPSKT
jgi:hypothetical protein